MFKKVLLLKYIYIYICASQIYIHIYIYYIYNGLGCWEIKFQVF